jgi:carboxypeptidase family protein/TonB-dependent receptor-like protein
MKFNAVLLSFSSLFLLAVFSNELPAQTTTSGALTGVVTDASKAIVPDAVVEIRDVAKGTVQTAKTDRDGMYRFFFLPPGRYILTVTHDGFQKESAAVSVILGPPVSLNISLEILRAKTTVRVRGEAPLLNAENGDVSTTMNQQQISELPNPGNDITYIAQTAPGAIMKTEGAFGNFSILGMPSTSNLFTLNGMNDTDSGVNVSGAMNMTLGQNQIQEATVVSNGYSGQFGGAAGPNINYITKSGGNTFHGNAVYYWNGRVLNANDWFNNALGTPRPSTNANQWAGSLGGPIKKDKLFFFFNTEGLRVFLPIPAPVLLPSAQFEAATIANIDSIFGPSSASDAFYKQMFNLYKGTPGASLATPGSFSDRLGCNGFVGPNGLGTTVPCAVHFQKTIGQPTYESIISGRVDWNIRSNDRVFVLVQYDHGRQGTYTDPISPLFNVTSNQPIWQGQLNETHIFGPTATNELLVAAWNGQATWSVANPSKTFSAFPTTLNWFSAGYAFSPLGGDDSFPYPSPSYYSSGLFQLTDDFVKSQGQHRLGFGVNFLRTHADYSFYTQNAVGTLAPQSLQAFYFGGVDPSSPKTDFTNLSQSFALETSQRFSKYNLGFYLQDEWRLRQNLTLMFALRADHPSNPVCERRCFVKLAGPFDSISHDPNQPYNQALILNQKQAFQNTDSLQWSPRFSFAWQPLGVLHNLVIRGGIGIFYDSFPSDITASLSDNPPLLNSFNVHGYNLTPKEANSLFKVAASSNTNFLNGFAAGQTLAQIQQADPFFAPPAINVVDNKTHWPQFQRWSLQLQQTFAANSSLSLGYSGMHGIHGLVQNPSANAFGFGPFPAQLCSSPPVPPCADPRFSQVMEFTTRAVSNYNGMIVSFEQRFNRWGQGLFQVNYTFGHALDEVSNGGLIPFTFGSLNFPQDPTNLRGGYGSADYDVRHSLNANYVWEIPVKAMLRGHGSDYLVSGWQVSGTIFARTATPYTAIDYAETGNLAGNNFFGLVYAVPVSPLGSQAPCGKGAAVPAAPHPCQPPQVLVFADGTTIPNPNALFVQSGCETGFNMGTLPGPTGPCSGPAVSFVQGRNRFRAAPYFNTDLTILKNTRIPGWENAVLGIGFQFFNVFNHPNFATPDSATSDGMFGQISVTSQPPTSILGSGLGGDSSVRMIQLKVELKF